MTQELQQTVSRLQRRLWIERGLFIGILSGMLITWLVPTLLPAAYVVTVDGKPVVSLRDKDAAQAALEQVKAASGAPATSTFVQNVRLSQGRPSSLTVNDAVAAVARLKPLLKMRADRGVICVDGHAVVALPDAKAAQELLDHVKSRYASDVQKLSSAPRFKENVEVRTEQADQELWADADTALALLTGEGADEGTHTIQAGDNVVSIARQYEITQADFRRLNPGVNDRRLKVGQTVRVGDAAKPLITVVTEGQVTRTEAAPYETVVKHSPKMYAGKVLVKRAGKAGKVRLTLKERFENGQPVEKQVLARAVLAPSQAKVVVLGDKPRPNGG